MCTARSSAFGSGLQRRWWKLCLGPEARQPDHSLVLLGELIYLLVLPYSHDSVPTPEPVCLVTWDETKANVCCPRLPLHLSREGLYYSPRAVNHSAVDTIRQFHQAHLQAAGWGAELHTEQKTGSRLISFYFQPAVCFKFIIKCHSCKIHSQWLVKYCTVIRSQCQFNYVNVKKKKNVLRSLWFAKEHKTQAELGCARSQVMWKRKDSLWQRENKCVHYTFYGESPIAWWFLSGKEPGLHPGFISQFNEVLQLSSGRSACVSLCARCVCVPGFVFVYVCYNYPCGLQWYGANPSHPSHSWESVPTQVGLLRPGTNHQGLKLPASTASKSEHKNY